MSSFGQKMASRICGLVAAIVVLAHTGCAHDTARTDHMILVTIDTLRADHLGAYGYAQARTPTLDGFALESIVFERAWSVAPLTLPSHASMLSGQLPFEHGMRNNDIFRPDDSEPMLPEILADHGFATSAVVSAFVLDSGFGLARGFESYVDDFRPDGPQERRADEVTTLAIEQLDTLGDRPFFLWVHYFDPHHPYATAESAIDGYDREISFVDEQLGRLFAALETRGLYEDAAIAVLSDHGEAFGEHNETEHGYFIYDTTIRVPLMLRLPDAARGGERADEPVCVTDVFPTLLDLAGAPHPDREHARSLLSPDGDRVLYAETLSPFANHGASPLASARHHGWKYIEAPLPELYDLSSDPDELTNLLESDPSRGRDLRAKLAALNDLSWMTSADPLRDSTRDLETQERLAALGYTSSPARQRSEWRPDPKVLAEARSGIESGDRAAARGDLEAAEAAYRSVLDAVPADWKATWKLGDLLTAKGDLEGAARVYEDAIAHEPDNLGARVRLALVRLAQDRPAAALEQLDLCVAGAPSYLPAHLHRADALARLDRVEEARREIEIVLELDPQHEAALRFLDALGRD